MGGLVETASLNGSGVMDRVEWLGDGENTVLTISFFASHRLKTFAQPFNPVPNAGPALKITTEPPIIVRNPTCGRIFLSKNDEWRNIGVVRTNILN
jgi:hypothetical protein